MPLWITITLVVMVSLMMIVIASSHPGDDDGPEDRNPLW